MLDFNATREELLARIDDLERCTNKLKRGLMVDQDGRLGVVDEDAVVCGLLCLDIVEMGGHPRQYPVKVSG